MPKGGSNRAVLAALVVLAGWTAAATQCCVAPKVGPQEREIPPFGDTTTTLCIAQDCLTQYGLLFCVQNPGQLWVDSVAALLRFAMVYSRWDCAGLGEYRSFIYVVQCAASVMETRAAVRQFSAVYNLIPWLPQDKVSPKIWAGTGFSGGEIDTVHGLIWVGIKFVDGIDSVWADSVVGAHADTIAYRADKTMFFAKGSPAALRELAFVEGVFSVHEADTTLHLTRSVVEASRAVHPAPGPLTRFDLRGRRYGVSNAHPSVGLVLSRDNRGNVRREFSQALHRR